VFEAFAHSTARYANRALHRQAKSIHEHPICWLGFEEDCIVTSCKNGTSLLVLLNKAPPKKPRPPARHAISKRKKNGACAHVPSTSCRRSLCAPISPIFFPVEILSFVPFPRSLRMTDSFFFARAAQAIFGLGIGRRRGEVANWPARVAMALLSPHLPISPSAPREGPVTQPLADSSVIDRDCHGR